MRGFFEIFGDALGVAILFGLLFLGLSILT